jgi:hypothetical protein
VSLPGARFQTGGVASGLACGSNFQDGERLARCCLGQPIRPAVVRLVVTGPLL